MDSRHIDRVLLRALYLLSTLLLTQRSTVSVLYQRSPRTGPFAEAHVPETELLTS
jgi:hypothetical protein